MPEIAEAREKVVRILKDCKACLSHELTDRAWLLGLRFNVVNDARDQLLSEKVLDQYVEHSPYGKPFHFYFLSETSTSEVDRTIKRKLNLLWEHSKRTEDVGRFAEIFVGGVLEGLGYTEIEVRKESHKGVGIGRRDIDVWGRHPKYNFYQNIEVKNRRQPVNVGDVKDIEAKSITKQAYWRVPVKSAIVCSFIYSTAFEESMSSRIPVVITEKVYVPNKFEEFYTEYKNDLGAYYIEIADLYDPPDYLFDKIEKYILQNDYDAS